jgi:hypothetical protein
LPRNDAPFTFRHYRRILESGLESGYRFIRFEELPGARESERYLCLLRHDCEGDLVTALRLGQLEKELRITSTYFVQLRSPLYNVLSRPHGQLVRRLLELGHGLGLHFDERSHEGASPSHVADLVDRERELLGAEFGVSVEVVSFHQPSARVLENKIKVRCLNTYDRSDMRGVGYLSDSNWRWREDPIAAFRSHSHPHLQLLLHPECWTYSSMPVERKWHQVLRDNVEIAQETLLEREDTYKRRARISFRS